MHSFNQFPRHLHWVMYFYVRLVVTVIAIAMDIVFLANRLLVTDSSCISDHDGLEQVFTCRNRFVCTVNWTERPVLSAICCELVFFSAFPDEDDMWQKRADLACYLSTIATCTDDVIAKVRAHNRSWTRHAVFIMIGTRRARWWNRFDHVFPGRRLPYVGDTEWCRP